ncbi:hypothetical protein KNV45_gp19 [uncultured phage cr271_1]|uniref:Uncharacterized protein n=1 Tax=uncultured phage cr271_1 TaxID=2772078 RepID=A0A7M1S1U2_9CAUD|nr:hypothetical protein KNV45_gp19 [uncultured phage cr271_1]QOR59839.1 hypothetical protein [uncultured phage cr271_1]
MAVADIDFEGTSGNGTGSGTGNGNEGNGGQGNGGQEDVTNLNGGSNADITGQDGNHGGDGGNGDQGGNQGSEGNNGGENDGSSSTGELSEGDTIEFDGTTYTVDASGNLVDDKGNVFKEAKDVADWLKSVEVEGNGEGSDTISLASIQEALGIIVTDAEGKNIEFTDDAAGVKAYVDAVIDLKSKDLQQAAVNKLYADNPLLKQFTDYVQLTGTAKGFGEIPDRSGIQLDKENEDQLKAVIRMAAKEFGNKSLNENYIKYLKDSGGLYDEAKVQLQALVEKDVAVRRDIEARAQAQRDTEAKAVSDYWNKVNNVINSRIIAGYKLPESFTKEVNGQKVIITPNDFYNYLSKATETDTDGNKVTGYQRDLNKLTDDEYLNRELLDAWLMFTGGTYKDLIAMAVNEDKVRQLRVKSKEQRSTKTVKVIKKQGGKVDMNDIVL